MERDRCKVFQTPLPPSFDPAYWLESRVRINSWKGKAGNEWFPKMSFTQREKRF